MVRLGPPLLRNTIGVVAPELRYCIQYVDATQSYAAAVGWAVGESTSNSQRERWTRLLLLENDAYLLPFLFFFSRVAFVPSPYYAASRCRGNVLGHFIPHYPIPLWSVYRSRRPPR